MMIGINNTVSIYRLESASNKESYASTALLDSLPVYIENLDPALAAMLDNAHAFETYRMYVDGNEDIAISDKVVDAQANEYVINGVQRLENNTDVDNHIEVTMYKLYTE